MDAIAASLSVAIGYWYENSANNTQDAFMPPKMMERSFYKTLEEFPILSGRLKANSNNRLYIDIDKDDLNMPVYTDTCCDLEYSILRDSGFNIHKLPIDLRNEYGVAAPSGLFGGDITSAHFRIFRFKDNSGVLVYAQVAHFITDGYGYSQFMNRWSEVSRWMQQPQDANTAPLPKRQFIHDRSIHNEYRSKQTTCLEEEEIKSFTTSTAFTRWLAWLAPETRGIVLKTASRLTNNKCFFFRISPKTIEDIRVSVQKHAPEGTRYSINDILTAYLTIIVGQAKEKARSNWWSKPIPSVIRALSGNRLGKSKDLAIATAVNIRGRSSNPDAKHYMGNMVAGKSVTVPQKLIQVEPTDESLSDLALRIHQAVASANEQRAGQIGYLLNKEPDSYALSMWHRATKGGKLVVSNQSRFPHYEVNFGAGMPSMVRHAPHAFTYTVYVMPANPKTGGGYEIEMNMPPAIEAHLVKNNTWMKLVDSYDTRNIMLTIGLGGLQFVWSVEMGFGSPYLLSLGLQKSVISLVWLAGPLSGLITQPLVGFLSDNCTSKLGRRRPYIIGATVIVILSLTTIGWAREIAGGRQLMAIWLAVVAFYVLDFAVNCVQASLRALIVDSLPTSRQNEGTAWASRMIGVGNVLGYLMGFLDLPRLLPFIGSTHMQVLTTIASVVLAICVFVTCYSIKEVPITTPPASGTSSFKMFSSLISSLHSLPVVVKQIFRVQFFAWIGWFPFLFYSTTYIADIYIANHGGSENETISDMATRAASLAMFVHAVGSLVFSILLPVITYSAAAAALRTTAPQPMHSSHTQGGSLSFLGRARGFCTRVLEKISVSLPTMWSMSQSVFAVSMILTLVVSTTKGATVLMGACGLSWAVTMWVPFSMLGEIISGTSGSSTSSSGSSATVIEGSSRNNNQYIPVSNVDGDDEDIPLDSVDQNRLKNTTPRDSTNDEGTGSHALEAQETAEPMSAGTVLGLHNVFAVVPQFITALASSLIFALFEHVKDTKPDAAGGQHAMEIAIVFCIGGLSSAVAAYRAWKLSSY
ncbi:hypothetical protein EV175_002334 [Coemansia sp. RSA 1933]|nr:hypothetical protein EV175_002334 [Coemansia sp. RSA 1933]